ncbi:hypothetical protein JCM5350_006793 [Sporobolomyces pararoseus]
MSATRLLERRPKYEAKASDTPQEEDFPIRSNQHAKNQELVAKARKVGEWSCWISVASVVVGGIVCITGFVASPQATTKHRVWFGMALGAWACIAVVLAVLFWELMDKLNRHGTKLVERCRLAYMIVAISCTSLLILMALVWAFNDSFSDSSLASSIPSASIALNLVILLIGVGASLIFYSKYSKLVKQISISTAQLPKDNIAKQLQRKVSNGAGSLVRSAAGSVKSMTSTKSRRFSQASTLLPSESGQVEEEDRLPQNGPEWNRAASVRSERMIVAEGVQGSDGSNFSSSEEQAQQPKNRQSRNFSPNSIPRKPIPLPKSTHSSFSESSDDSEPDREASELPLILQTRRPPSRSAAQSNSTLPSWKRPDELFFPSSQTSSTKRLSTSLKSTDPNSSKASASPQYKAYSPPSHSPAPTSPSIPSTYPPLVTSSRRNTASSLKSGRKTPLYVPPPPPPLPLVPGTSYDPSPSSSTRNPSVKSATARGSSRVSVGYVEKEPIRFEDEGYDSDSNSGDGGEGSYQSDMRANSFKRGQVGGLRVVNT